MREDNNAVRQKQTLWNKNSAKMKIQYAHQFSNEFGFLSLSYSKCDELLPN